MYRFFGLALVFAAVACGGGGASSEPTPTSVPATNTVATQEVAGARTQTPVSPTAAAAPNGQYTVVEGDTLGEIAARFDTTVEALVAANGLANADELTIGQVLKVAASAATGTPSPGATAGATATATQ